MIKIVDVDVFVGKMTILKNIIQMAHKAVGRRRCRRAAAGLIRAPAVFVASSGRIRLGP